MRSQGGSTSRRARRAAGTLVLLALAAAALAGCNQPGFDADAFSALEPPAEDLSEPAPAEETGVPKEGSCCDPGDPTWVACQDDLFCNGVEQCTCWGDCEPGPPINCNDGDPVTRDWCREADPLADPPVLEGCGHSGRDCNSDADCDDSNLCTSDSCDAGMCGHIALPAGTDCDDGLYCNGGATCNAAAQCVLGIGPCPLACQGCNELTDTCTILSGYCFIGSFCYTDGATNPVEQCESCQPAVDQTDWNWKAVGTRCDDGLFCTLTDTCDAAHLCSGTGDRCPLFQCVNGCNEGADACLMTPPGTLCRTSTGVCDAEEECDGVSFFCPDDNPGAMDGMPCDDLDDCTDPDACDEHGMCVGTVPPTGCNEVTWYGMTNGGGIAHTPNYRITIGVGMPQAMGLGSTANYRMVIGPAALH